MLKYSKEFPIISSPPLRYKRNSLLLSTYPRKRWREQLMLRYAVFDRGIKICTTLPLGFLCSAGFLDHRVIILAVMDLTKIAANGICAWCLFSMHLRLVYPLASFACPPWPMLYVWTQAACPLALSLPPQAQGCCQGTKRWSMWVREQCCLCLQQHVCGLKLHITFPWMSRPNTVCYWLWMMELLWPAYHYRCIQDVTAI